MKSEKTNEFLTGVIIALFLTIAFVIKVQAAEPVLDEPLAGQTICYEVYPQTKEIEESRQRLEEIGVRIPNDVIYWCRAYGDEYGICPEVLEAICWVESNCISSISSADGSCKGLMQIKPSSHSKRMIRLNVNDIYDVKENIAIGSDYLHELMQTYDLTASLMAYNGDTGAIERYQRTGELSGYANKVLTIAKDLERIHFK